MTPAKRTPKASRKRRSKRKAIPVKTEYPTPERPQVASHYGYRIQTAAIAIRVILEQHPVHRRDCIIAKVLETHLRAAHMHSWDHVALDRVIRNAAYDLHDRRALFLPDTSSTRQPEPRNRPAPVL